MAPRTLWVKTLSGLRFSGFGGGLFTLEMAVVVHLGDLDVVHLVIFDPTELLRLKVLGMHPPGLLALLVLKLDDGDALAVVGPEALVRDVSRYAPGDLLHAVNHRRILVL